MIGYLTGIIKKNLANPIIVNVKVVGYADNITQPYFASVKKNTEVYLFIKTHVKDESIDLYGFIKEEEKQLFDLLISVSGIGPKTALLVVDRGVDAVRKAISTADVEFFTSTPRLGKKNAQKIIIELKSKIGSIEELDLKGTETSLTLQVKDALLSMGFDRKEVKKALSQIKDEYTQPEEMLRQALKLLGK